MTTILQNNGTFTPYSYFMIRWSIYQRGTQQTVLNERISLEKFHITDEGEISASTLHLY